jgi:nicotinate-nucleotide adenylyltransferase
MLGTDAFLNFNSWKSSDEILKMSHIVVSYRPGYQIPELEPWTQGRVVKSAEELDKHKAGKFIFLEVTQLAISATDIRRKLLDGLSARYLMPIDVADYIHDNQLYYSGNDQSQSYERTDVVDIDCHAVLSG